MDEPINKSKLKVALLMPLNYDARLVGEGIWRIIKEIIIANATKPDSELDLTIIGPEWIRQELEEELRTALGNRANAVRRYIPDVSLPMLRAAWRLHQREKERINKRQEKRLITTKRKQEIKHAVATILSKPVLAFFASTAFAPIGFYFSLKYRWQDREKKAGYLTRWLASRAAASLLEGEIFSIVKRYDREYKPDLWWVPYPTAPGITGIGSNRVSHIYDLAYADYPKGQNLNAVALSKLDISVSINKAKCVITHSQHVRDRVGIPMFGIPAEKIFVIPHAAPNFRPYVTDINTGKMLSRGVISERIRNYCVEKRMKWPVIDTFVEEIIAPRATRFRFEEEKYVLLSTQNRSYKNVIQVAKAIKLLNHQHSKKIYLVLTGDFKPMDRSDALAKYVINNNLVQYILPLPRVPDDILAGLYACAALAIHPSLYEGGVGAFPFYEGLSVDCPVLVSLNDSMREALLEEPGYSICIFNPFNLTELCTKIDRILQNRDAALREQKPVYERVTKLRTWASLLDEYTKVFKLSVQS